MSNKIDWSIIKVLPTDYKDYGGEVERWADGDDYPDCSCGCKWFQSLDEDWGVCVKPGAPRAGLLTWEHQAGKDCYEMED